MNQNPGGDLPRLALTFLDPEFFAGTASETTPGKTVELETEYICVVCCGVVLDPLECKNCSSLYCKSCLPQKDMPCPKRCGGAEYGKVNRLIMNALNKLPFKCQYNPKCDKIIPYEAYMAHYMECQHGKPQPCENADCQMRIRNLQNQVHQLQE